MSTTMHASAESALGIALNEIVFAYANRQVVKRANLHLPAGQFGAILGRNGSGKSTLLRIAAGVQAPQSGQVLVAGHDLGQMDIRQRAKHVGFLAQFHQPEFSFLVREVVLTGRASSVFSVPGAADYAAAEQAMHELGISHLADRSYDELSGGERQMVMVARLLAQAPSALLLDEPVSSLDLANQIHLLQTLRRLADKGLTVLAILHDPNHALMFSDELVLLRKLTEKECGDEQKCKSDSNSNHQNVVAAGRPTEVMTPENIFEAYGIDVEFINVRKRLILLPL